MSWINDGYIALLRLVYEGYFAAYGATLRLKRNRDTDNILVSTSFCGEEMSIVLSPANRLSPNAVEEQMAGLLEWLYNTQVSRRTVSITLPNLRDDSAWADTHPLW